MLRKLFTFLLIVFVIAFTTQVIAISGQAGGKDSSGNYHWLYSDDGDQYSPADCDIGTTSYPVNELKVDTITIGGSSYTSFSAVTGAMTDYSGYVCPTDSGTKLKLHDDGDLTLGGAVATDVIIIFDSDTNDYYIGVNDSENELQIGYGSAMGTTEQMSFSSAAKITLGEDTDVDFGLIFQSGAQDYYVGIDYTGGQEEDLLTFGRGSTVGATPELSIGATAVYVNHLDAPGNVDFDIGSADVDDVTVTTDGGVLILDGTITLTDAEILSNPTDDTVRVESNDTDITFEIYGIADKDAILALTADASADNGDDWTLKNDDADSNNLIWQNDSSGSAVTYLTFGKTGIITTTNYIENKITDTGTNSVTDVCYLTHDGGTAAAGVGTGLVYQIDDAGGIEEQGSIDVSLSTVTDAAEEADMIVRLNTTGTMRDIFKIDNDTSATECTVFELYSWTIETDGVVDVLEINLDNTADTAIDGFGAGISIVMEDETNTAEEQASIDFVLTDAGTTTEDCDIVFSQNVAGGIVNTLLLDADSGMTYASAVASQPLFWLENTKDDATCPIIALENDRATEADGDDLGIIKFIGSDGGDVAADYVTILAEANEINATDDAGKLTVSARINDVDTTFIDLFGDTTGATTGHVNINTGAADIDFHIDGDNQADLFKTDAGTDSIDMDLAQTTSRLLITTGVAGTATESLIWIDDNRTGATANTKEEATLEIDPQGTHAIHIVDGISHFGGACEFTGGRTSAPVAVTDAAAYTVLASNSGKVHAMPNLAADCTISLPTEAAGLYYKFVYAGAAEDAHDWIIQATANANYFKGGCTDFDDDDGTLGVVYANGSTNSQVSILTPNAGTSVEMWCDGTNWILNGQVVSGTDTATVFADQ